MLLIVTIIIAVLAGLSLLFYLFIKTPAARLKRFLFWGGGTISIGVLIFLLYRLSGSFIWSWIVFLIPLILRWRGLFQQIRNAAKTVAGPAKGQVSSVNTEFLEMSLHHDTGEMSGLIKKGDKKGQKVESLNLHQLFELLVTQCDIHRIFLTTINHSWRLILATNAACGSRTICGSQGGI